MEDGEGFNESLEESPDLEKLCMAYNKYCLPRRILIIYLNALMPRHTSCFLSDTRPAGLHLLFKFIIIIIIKTYYNQEQADKNLNPSAPQPPDGRIGMETPVLLISRV